jgi:hypothetical protein
MNPQTDFVRWLKEWDWRLLARLLAWGLLVAAWSHRGPLELLILALRMLRNLALAYLFTWGLLAYPIAVAVRLVMGIEEAAYVLSERIVRPFLGSPFRPASFLAAVGVEMLLVLGAVAYWRAAHVGPYLCTQLAGVLL